MRTTERLVIGGPANSGKSTLAASLALALTRHVPRRVGLYELDPYSDTHECILGKKPWSQRHKDYHPSYEKIQATNLAFREDDADFVIGDLPGAIQNPILPELARGATVALILSRDINSIPEWENFFRFTCRIPILMRVYSCVSPRDLSCTLCKQRAVDYCVRGLDRTLSSDPGVLRVSKHIITNLLRRTAVA